MRAASHTSTMLRPSKRSLRWPPRTSAQRTRPSYSSPSQIPRPRTTSLSATRSTSSRTSPIHRGTTCIPTTPRRIRARSSKRTSRTATTSNAYTRRTTRTSRTSKRRARTPISCSCGRAGPTSSRSHLRAAHLRTRPSRGPKQATAAATASCSHQQTWAPAHTTSLSGCTAGRSVRSRSATIHTSRMPYTTSSLSGSPQRATTCTRSTTPAARATALRSARHST